jgi:signal transduction histidine kinase
MDRTDEMRVRNTISREREKAEFLLDLLAHEIGNIHHGILSGCQMARSAENPEYRKSSLESAESLINRSIDLVRKILQLSRIDVSEPEMRRMSIGQVMREAMNDVREKFKESDITFSLEEGPEELEIMAEPPVKDIFVNILQNGIRFQEGKVPKMEASVKKENGMVVVQISDSGTGMDDLKKEAFMAASRWEEVATSKWIGLSLVKALAQRYDATLEVKDRVEGNHTEGLVVRIGFPSVDQ